MGWSDLVTHEIVIDKKDNNEVEEPSPALLNFYSCQKSFGCYVLLPLAGTWGPSDGPFANIQGV